MVHVVDRDFGGGLSPFSKDSPAMETLLRTTATDDFTLHLIHLQDYDELYDIYDKRIHGPQDIQPTLGYNPIEDPYTGSSMETYLKEIITCKLPTIFNMSAVELLQLPAFVLEPYLVEGRKARNKEVEDKRRADQEEREQNRQMKLPFTQGH